MASNRPAPDDDSNEPQLTTGRLIRRARVRRNMPAAAVGARMQDAARANNRPVAKLESLTNMISKYERDERVPDEINRRLLCAAMNISVEDIGLTEDPDVRLKVEPPMTRTWQTDALAATTSESRPRSACGAL